MTSLLHSMFHSSTQKNKFVFFPCLKVCTQVHESVIREWHYICRKENLKMISNQGISIRFYRICVRSICCMQYFIHQEFCVISHFPGIIPNQWQHPPFWVLHTYILWFCTLHWWKRMRKLKISITGQHCYVWTTGFSNWNINRNKL